MENLKIPKRSFRLNGELYELNFSCMFLVFGTVVHIVIGMSLRLIFGWRFGIVATIFAAKEFGELKNKFPGSITTVGKNIAMLAELITNANVLAQWLLPALAAWGMGILLTKAKTFPIPSTKS